MDQTTNKPVFIPYTPKEEIKTVTVNTPHNTVEVAVAPQQSPKTTDLGHHKLLSCLYFLFDAFERTGLQFFLVRDTARKAMTEYQLEGDRLDIGIRQLEWNNDQKDILFPYFAQEHVEEVSNLPTELTFKWQDVPFTLHIYEDNPHLTALVPIVYEHEHWLVPNKFEEFDKAYDK